MTTFLKSAMKRSVAENLLRDLSRTENQYFFFVAKCTPWTTENSPALYIDSDQGELTVSRSIIGYKKINPASILFTIPKYQWLSGTKYDQYEDTIDLFDPDNPKIFYVLTNQRNIYKCISNAGGAASTAEPSAIISSPFQTVDKYIWKYLGTVKESDLLENNSEYLPINFIYSSTDIETQNQYNTQVQAIPGAISRIDITQGAIPGIYDHSIPNTTSFPGLKVSNVRYLPGGTDTMLEITDAASINKISQLENITTQGPGFLGHIVRVVQNSNNIAEINNYGVIVDRGVTAQSNRYFTIRNDVIDFSLTAPASSTNPVIEILPYIKIRGDGVGAYVFPGMTGTFINYSIEYVDVINSGQDYSHAKLDIITPPITNTNNPTLVAINSPKGGHGSNILRELNADRVVLIIALTPEDESIIQTGGTYRQFGIIKNPKLFSEKGTLAGILDKPFRDIVLVHNDVSDTASVANTIFSLSNTTVILGTESFSASKVHTMKSANSTTKRVTIKTGSVSDTYTTYQDRPNDYILTLANSGPIFTPGEAITQYIPVGVTFNISGSSSSTGVSFGYGILAEGIVLDVPGIVMGGRTLGVRSTRNSFAITTSSGLTGAISGATGTINSIVPRYGEYIFTAQVSGGSTFTSENKFKILDVGIPYFDANDAARYNGLYKLHLSTSGSGVTGATDTTSALLTQTSFLSGDTISQGAIGSYTSDYASATVYRWEFINNVSGILWVSEVEGKFKNVVTDGITGSGLGKYIIADVTLPDIDLNSGEILYIDNVTSVERIIEQDEKFRLTIGF